ncbi:DNA phosphorothioation system sulfurtransferase DndC [Candidatus Parabeggiatoa sp. HSG14]|uniref:DNA phosphorothioation system sulfurtransferase DndC n=1 Tax=Candidatus Parabeggiatoa sp. HSG14 TaxID=3055593 RepID=UPI0025A907AA|nr:DNA phosphorothioation system sulfurtransferase DndC [Thiotrichales bacterium HSG14]
MNTQRKTAFVTGFKKTVQALVEQTQTLYLSDGIPWVVGYSGGKDSTAALQLIWYAVSKLPEKKRIKPVYVISTDTLVENPIVALWVESSLEAMEKAAIDQNLPITPHRLTPEVADRFWVNLIGRGYPAPRPKFRWCTSRLKINPSNNFINNVIRQNGQVILVLGTRKAESVVRAVNMAKHEKTSTREKMATNASLPNSWIYTPIADWTNDDVWMYITQVKNPWEYNNKALLSMYQGATADGECPLVVDTSTPSCGDSRFGCYVCTMVEQDKSMQAMIQNDEEKEWMLPLMKLRNEWLDIKEDRKHRDFRRMSGVLKVVGGRLVHGPYKQAFREKLLRALLQAQQDVQKDGPPEVKNLELITYNDLEEIRRLWVMEKHEIEDNLPKIYERVMKQPYPGKRLDDNQVFQPEDIILLKEICQQEGDNENIHFQLIRELLHLEQQHRTMARRAGLYDSLDKSLERNAFENAQEAEEFALRRKSAVALARGEEDNTVENLPLFTNNTAIS